MATLRHVGSGVVEVLSSRTLVGRSPAAFLRVDRPNVSNEHALFRWTGGWSLRDLGSRNGTFVDGRRIEPGASAAVVPGTLVAFGDPGDAWRLETDEAPEVMAIELASRSVCVGHAGLLALPSEGAPDVSVYTSTAGAWVTETDGVEQSVADQQVVYAGGLAWCLCLPEATEGTPLVEAELSLGNLGFHFGVSANEEHVELSLVHRGKRVPLETREHNYVLLLLARRRLADRQPAVAERGWIEVRELLRMLRMRQNTLAVAIHRARRTLAEMGVLGAPGIVEMRRGHRRFGSDRIEIEPL